MLKFTLSFLIYLNIVNTILVDGAGSNTPLYKYSMKRIHRMNCVRSNM